MKKRSPGTNRPKPRTAKAAVLTLISLNAMVFCFLSSQAGSQGTRSKPFDLKNPAVLKGFTPVADEFYNKKPEAFWYKGSSRFITKRFFHGFSEVNYTVLRFSSRQAMVDWDARFARIGIRTGWRVGDVFKNGAFLTPKVASEIPVSQMPGPTGLVALHLDFSVGNTVVLVGGNQHKIEAQIGTTPPQGLTDAQLTRTVQAVAQELKRQAASSDKAKL